MPNERRKRISDRIPPGGQCCFKGGEHNYSSDAPGRREDRYCVGDIPKEALNNRLKWAEIVTPPIGNLGDGGVGSRSV
jgi:hypothetical protein